MASEAARAPKSARIGTLLRGRACSCRSMRPTGRYGPTAPTGDTGTRRVGWLDEGIGDRIGAVISWAVPLCQEM